MNIKDGIYRRKGTGLFIGHVLVKDGEIYEFRMRGMGDEKGYCKVTWVAQEPPYKRIVRRYKYMKFINKCDTAPFLNLSMR